MNKSISIIIICALIVLFNPVWRRITIRFVSEQPPRYSCGYKCRRKLQFSPLIVPCCKSNYIDLIR